MALTTRNSQVQDLLDQAGLLALSDTPVLLVGERGVGKERLARYIHARSRRSGGPFIKVDPAFGGADKAAAGLDFGAAAGGTLFLAGLPQPDVDLIRQAPPGVRVIAAAAYDPETWLHGAARLYLPPLSQRKDDLELLTREVLTELAPVGVIPTLSAEAMGAILLHNWPGNISELKRALRQAVQAAGPGCAVELLHLPDPPARLLQPGSAREIFKRYTRSAELLLIRWALAACGDDRTRTARFLGLSRAALYKKLKLYPEFGDAL